MTPAKLLILTSLVLPLVAGAACKTENDTSIPPNARVIRQNIVLKKKYQRVIRYDCNVDVITDKVELIGPPADKISIASEGEYARYDVGFSVYNRTTCEDKGFANIFAGGVTAQNSDIFAQTSKAEMYFKVNSESNEYMWVKKGQDNYIDFTFSECLSGASKSTAGSACKIEHLLETGVLILNVDYKEVLLDGYKEIYKSEKECEGLTEKEVRNNTKWARYGSFFKTKLFGEVGPKN